MDLIDIDYVKEYIKEEIDYIKSYEDLNNDYVLNDLIHLKELSEEQIQEITNKVNNSEEINNKILEEIHYYLYH